MQDKILILKLKNWKYLAIVALELIAFLLMDWITWWLPCGWLL